jgi:hypothetical protein
MLVPQRAQAIIESAGASVSGAVVGAFMSFLL